MMTHGKYNITGAEERILRENKISKATFILRISKYGWSRHDALHTPTTPAFTLTPRERKIMEEHNVNYHTARSRVLDWGWSKRKAITTKAPPRLKTTPFQRQVMRDNDLDIQLVSRRVSRGWSVDEAVFVKKRQPRSRYKEYRDAYMAQHEKVE